ERLRAARTLLALGRELGLEANLEGAQEIVYEAAQSGAPFPEGMREFALALGLAPAALPPAAEADGEAALTLREAEL
ncbi:MAG TPA: hypothetical protein VN228_13450, partial [Pyrinomonadaceae bacterium]|nr:hypothetical protein [Pyrinomonadaceae bacterium]